MVIPPEKFATSSLRSFPKGPDICRLLSAVIHSADAGMAVKKHLSLDSGNLITPDASYDLEAIRHIYVIGAGKAVIPMATTVNDLLGERITKGIVIAKDGYAGSFNGLSTSPIEVRVAGHPIPDQRNVDASNDLLAAVQSLTPDDLVLCLISGGGSALLTTPVAGISLEDMQATTALLLGSGASIGEINTIRKHLDMLKGGGLAKLLYPAKVISLILSDVVGDALELVGSGPTTADNSTCQDAWSVLEKYQLIDQIPPQVHTYLSEGMIGEQPETIKPGDPALENVQNILVGSNPLVAQAAAQAAETFGFHSRVLTEALQGEASHAGRILAEHAKSILTAQGIGHWPACLIAGGETTVTLEGSGKGGRNQELVLGAVMSIAGFGQLLMVSLATDGQDGPTDAAGAVISSQTYSLGLSRGLTPDFYLKNNDAYHYFEPLGDLLKTGPTHTNVNDLVFIFSV